MHKNKVVIVLKSLSAEEMRQLDKFVRSPVHNQHDEVIRLFQYLRRQIDGNERALDKEKVFNHLFHGENFNMQRIHYISSYLLRVVEEFLAWSEWRKSANNYQLSLLRSLRHHRLESIFENCHERAQSQLLNEGKVETESLLVRYQLELERFNNDRISANNQNFKLQELSWFLDDFIISEKLRNACILLSNQAVIRTNYDTGVLDKIIAFVEEKNMLSNPLIAAYYYACRTLQNYEDDTAYQHLKALLESHRNKFKTNELHDIYIFAINYCIRRFNSGSQHFMREVFDIYKFGLETDAFLQNETIAPRTYSNIVMSGLRANEFDWVLGFIQQYKDNLPEKQRLGFFNYNLARLYYEQKNYATAMPLLLQMEYEDVLLTCLGKILLAKMQFELKEEEALSSLLQSFKLYVKRKKMMGYHKESTMNFIVFLGKLTHNTPAHTDSLRDSIIKTKVVAEKEWLLAHL